MYPHCVQSCDLAVVQSALGLDRQPGAGVDLYVAGYIQDSVQGSRVNLSVLPVNVSSVSAY
jgi:hypothetical protein